VLSVNNIVEANNVLVLQFFKSEQFIKRKNTMLIQQVKKYNSIHFPMVFIDTYKLISRIAVLGIPSSSASRRIFLSAMISPVTLSLAL